jgi:Mn2+/Fe2+ NRAMP family transporter
VPIFVMAHPPLAEIGRGLIVPRFPSDGKLSDVMLLVIAIVGTTIAPWQLFFQQSYVIDKRITPRFMAYEKADLAIGIGVVLAGAIAIMAFAAAAFQGTPGFGQFTDAGALAKGLEAYAGRPTGVMFALALLDASIIGASAVSLATAYAIGDGSGAPALAAPQGNRRARILRGLCRPGRRGRDIGAARQRCAARLADHRGADAGGRAAAVRDGVSAAASSG